MSAEYNRHLPSPPIVDDMRGLVSTVEEAEEARRHAAEIGDYLMAQRWLWHERQLAAREGDPQPPIAGAREGRRHDPTSDRTDSPR